LEECKAKIAWLEDLVNDLVSIIQQDSRFESLSKFSKRNLRYILRYKALEQVNSNDKTILTSNYPLVLEKDFQAFEQVFGENLEQVVSSLEVRNRETEAGSIQEESPVLKRIAYGVPFLTTNFFKEWDYANEVVKFKRKDIEKGWPLNLRTDKSSGKYLALLKLKTGAKKLRSMVEKTDIRDFSQGDLGKHGNSEEEELIQTRILADLESENSKIVEGVYMAVLSMHYSNLHPRIRAGFELNENDIISEIFPSFRKRNDFPVSKHKTFVENIVINLLGDNISLSKDRRVKITNFIARWLISPDGVLKDRLLAVSRIYPSDEMFKKIYGLTVNDTIKTSLDSFKFKILEYRRVLMNPPDQLSE
jgi:hypothetical protein